MVEAISVMIFLIVSLLQVAFVIFIAFIAKSERAFMESGHLYGFEYEYYMKTVLALPTISLY